MLAERAYIINPYALSFRPCVRVDEVERVARRRRQTASEFVRAALRRYIDQEKAWRETLAYGRKKAKEQGIRSEEDIYRIMEELRHRRPSPPYAAASGRR